MNNREDTHLSDDELLLHADGELTGRDVDIAREHLDACWTCRARLDALQATINTVVRFRNEVLLPTMPPPPASWPGLKTRMEELAREIEEPSPLQRVGRALTRRSSLGAPSRRFIAWTFQPVRIAAIGAAIALVVWPFIRTDVISAKELLTHARDAEQQALGRVLQPVVYQRVQIRAGNRTVVRTTYRDTTSNRIAERIESSSAAGPTLNGGDNSATLGSVRLALETAGRDWTALLSATEYDAWRQLVSVAEETVSEQRGALLLTTIPAGGRIASSKLTLRANDYHPLSEAIQMRDDHSLLEITELAHGVFTLNELQPSVFGTALTETPTAKVTPPAPPPPVPVEALEEAELDVRRVLRELGADLVPGVEVRRRPRQIDVRGRLTSEIETTLRLRLAPIPHVVARTTPVPASAEGRLVGRSPVVGLLSWRLQTFGDAAAGEVALRDIYSLAERVRARAHAYDEMRQRYDESVASRLDTTGKEKLISLVQAHHTAMIADVDTLDRELALLLGSTTRTLLEPVVRNDWRERVAASTVAARELCESLETLFQSDVAVLDKTISGSEPPETGQVRRTMTALWRLFERQ